MVEKKINVIASCCITNNNKILFVQENKKDIQGLWDLPGGKLKVTENIKQAAIREVLEETGYDIELESILLIQNFINDKGELLIIYFNGTLLSEIQKEYRQKEINDVKWMTLEEIKSISKDKIRGGSSIEKIIKNIEQKVHYSLDILDIHENN